MISLKQHIAPLVGVGLAFFVFQLPILFSDHSAKLSNDQAAGILPYSYNKKKEEAIFLLSRGGGNWTTFAKPINPSNGIAEAAAKSFTENTLFMYGDSSYIKPKLCDGSLIKHPFKDSCLFVAPIDFKSSDNFQKRLQTLMQKYGKTWMKDHGVHSERFQWVKETELFQALNKAQDQILEAIHDKKNPNCILNNVTHNVSVNAKYTNTRLKLEASLVEFLLTPRCHEVLESIVTSNEGKRLLKVISLKNLKINESLKNYQKHHYSTKVYQKRNLQSLTGSIGSHFKATRL